MSRPRPGDQGFSEYWRDYHGSIESRPTNPFLDALEPHLPSPGLALDIGSGTGKTTVWLLQHGFDVWAQDADHEAMAKLLDRVSVTPGLEGNLSTVVVPFEQAEFPLCVLAVSVFSLFFTHPDAFEDVWYRIKASVVPGGVFGGQFLGPNDQWNGTGVSTHTSEQLRGMLEGWDTVHWEEVDRDGQTALGEPKRWHVFHVIARRPH